MMTTKRWPAVLAALALAAAPVTAQQAADSAGARGGTMGQGTMQMCQGLMGSGGMMGGHQGMMGSGGMMGGHQGTMGSGGMMGGHQGMMGSGSMMGAGTMMGAMPVGPSALLGAAEQLGLTDAQKSQLEELASKARGTHQAFMQAAMAARSAAAAALAKDEPDLDAYQTALQQAADQMVEAHVAMARAGLDAREVLQPEQRTKLDELLPTGVAGCANLGSGGMMGGTGVGGHVHQHG